MFDTFDNCKFKNVCHCIPIWMKIKELIFSTSSMSMACMFIIDEANSWEENLAAVIASISVV